MTGTRHDHRDHDHEARIRKAREQRGLPIDVTRQCSRWQHKART